MIIIVFVSNLIGSFLDSEKVNVYSSSGDGILAVLSLIPMLSHKSVTLKITSPYIAPFKFDALIVTFK